MHRRSFQTAAPIVILFGAALLLYLSFQSISLDDFDSVSFALALDHFDIALQQPHPPGFPVYVAGGRLARVLTGNPLTALTLVSAVNGAMAVAALAWLGASMGNAQAGWLAALWLMLLPVFWLSSGMALSDVPGIALVLLAVGCLWNGRASGRWLALGAALSGLCLGLRPQNGIPVALFGVYAVVVLLRKDRRDAILSIGAALVVGCIAVLCWLLPTVNATGGWEAYRSLVSAHSAHVVQIDSLFGRPITGETLTARISAAVQGLTALVGGETWLAVIALVIVLIGVVRAGWRSAASWLCMVWFALVAVQVFLLESLERPRLYLPFVPPLALLAALGWMSNLTPPPPLRKQRGGVQTVRFSRVISILLAALFAVTGLPLVIILTQQPSPPVQAAQFVAAHYTPDQTVIVSLGSFRHAQIGLSAYPQLYLGQFDAAGWAKSMAERQPVYLVLLDRDDIWPDAYTALTQNGDYVPVDDRLFRRDPRVFPQHSLVRMQVLTPLRLLTPSQLAPPVLGRIEVGDAANGKYFGEGWYRIEDVAGSSARWTQQTAVIRVALPSADTTMTIEAAPYPANQAVTILVNDQMIGTLELPDPWTPGHITIPASALAGHPISTITLRHAHAAVPPGSDRNLAAAYRVIAFGP